MHKYTNYIDRPTVNPKYKKKRLSFKIQDTPDKSFQKHNYSERKILSVFR